jgi:RimJ/RimL family protein N-acetyltransferase
MAILAATTVLETSRLVVRRMTELDAPYILELLNEPSFLECIGDRHVRTEEDARAYIRNGPVASYNRFGFGLYLVALKAAATPIGICGLLKRDTLPDVDVGFAFSPGYWHQGYAIEAARAVVEHGRRVLGLHRVVAITTIANLPSQRVLGKLGMAFEGMVRLGDDREELMLFGRDLGSPPAS